MPTGEVAVVEGEGESREGLRFAAATLAEEEEEIVDKARMGQEGPSPVVATQAVEEEEVVVAAVAAATMGAAAGPGAMWLADMLPAGSAAAGTDPAGSVTGIVIVDTAAAAVEG